MSEDRRGVLAGVDGSPESRTAARWAAAEALRRHTSLVLLCAYVIPTNLYSDGFPNDMAGEMEDDSRNVLADIRAELHEAHPGLDITEHLAHADARRALVDASQRAELTVVGTRGRGRLPEVAFGSVALHTASHADSPVAVIPAAAAPADGPILLGVDGLPDSDAAVRFAFDEAAIRDADLLVVVAIPRRRPHSFSDQLLRDLQETEEQTREPPPKGEYPWWETPPAPRQLIPPGESPEAHLVLAEQIAGYREQYPDVQVLAHTVTGRPADVLLDWAPLPEITTAPQLIVVGSRGRGGVSGLLLGSTGQAVITRTTVPVVVVAPRSAAS